jgi:Tfp pilus assembly protein PilV
MIHTNLIRQGTEAIARAARRDGVGLAVGSRWTRTTMRPTHAAHATSSRPGAARGLRPSCARSKLALGAEEGISLIEVMISALMVGFIVIATFTGFNNVDHTTADERAHDQAAVLAMQSLEELRSDSAATLDGLTNSNSHTCQETVGGETYTITQSARWVNDANPNATCSAIGKEHSNQAGDYLRVNTAITWPQLGKRPPLEQDSIITPPDGSGLEVDVTNGRIPEQPVAGVTIVAGEAEALTGESGCVIFGGIPATRITVEAFKLGDVTPAGAIKNVHSELLVAPNITTTVPAVLNEGARIKAEFTYEGKPVKSDTFVAYNSKINLQPDFEVGSTEFGEPAKETGNYEARTSKYETTATTPVSATYYPTGDLFPFENGWFAYAGDCVANNPHTIDESQITESAIAVPTLEPGQIATIKVPMSEVKLLLYNGTAAAHGSLESKSQAVKITDGACASSASPNNAAHYKIEHTQNTTSEGKLEYPYQPFGKSFKLCLYDKEKSETYTAEYADEAIKGPEIGIYLKETAGYEDGHGHKVTVKTGQSSNTC